LRTEISETTIPATALNLRPHFFRQIKRDFNLTILMIEHHMNLVMDISDRIYVIDFGELIATGTPEQVQNNPAVIAAYLGVDE